MPRSDSSKSDYYIADSQIQGQGVFLGRNFQSDEPIDLGIKFQLGIIPQVTPHFGSLINHSWEPNTYLKWDGQQGGHLVCAKKKLSKNAEITLDYRETPWYILGPKSTWK